MTRQKLPDNSNFVPVLNLNHNCTHVYERQRTTDKLAQQLDSGIVMSENPGNN